MEGMFVWVGLIALLVLSAGVSTRQPAGSVEKKFVHAVFFSASVNNSAVFLKSLNSQFYCDGFRQTFDSSKANFTVNYATERCTSELWGGCIWDNNIYVQPKYDLERQTAVLFHETAHYLMNGVAPDWGWNWDTPLFEKWYSSRCSA